MTILQRGILSHSSRGRLPAPWHSISDLSAFMYLMKVSRKHNISSSSFLKSFLDAWNNGIGKCGGISVKCRERREDYGVFLITKDRLVLGQLRLDKLMLRNMLDVDLPVSESRPPVQVKKSIVSKGKMRIKDLVAGTRGVNLVAKVVEKSDPKTVFSRFGTILLVSNITVSDATGSIKVSLWNDQIGTISVGDKVRIENGIVKMFKGEMLLGVSRKFGKLSVLK